MSLPTESDARRLDTCDARMRVLGDFQLIRELGRGGGGTVWEAWQTSLRRVVALKVISTAGSRDETARERFLREAEAGARLRHPNIVGVHAVGECDGYAYIAQELVEGGRTLVDQIDSWRRATDLPGDHYKGLAELFATIAEALHAAHQVGIVHRDIKPSNVLITTDGTPRVADFGIARLVDGVTLSRTGDVLGTPFYMSPEQVEGRRGSMTPQSDIFSLGATMYEALTFARAFDGDTSQLVMRRILTQDPPDPQRVRSRIPRDLSVICRKALEKEPIRRYASMPALAADLRRYLAHEPIHAHPPGRWVTATKWARRHPVLSTSCVAVGIALIIVSSLLWRIANEAERAIKAEQDALANAKRADEFATRAEETLKFMGSLIGRRDPLDPRTALTPEQQVAEGVAEVRRQFANDPRVAAKLLHAFGRIYVSLAKPAEANELFVEVVEVYREKLGANAAATLEAQAALGATLILLGMLDEAESVFEQGLARSTDKTLEARLAALQLNAGLGSLRFAQQRFEESREIFERVVLTQDELFDRDDSKRQITLANLGLVEQQLGRFWESERRLRELVELRRRILPPGHSLTMNGLNTLGLAYMELGCLGDAESCFREARDGLAAALSKEHPLTLNATNNLADTLVRDRRFEEAEPLARGVYEKRRATQGAAHEHALLSGTILVESLLGLGRAEEALPLARELVVLTPERSKARQRREALLHSVEVVTESR